MESLWLARDAVRNNIVWLGMAMLALTLALNPLKTGLVLPSGHDAPVGFLLSPGNLLLHLLLA
jgi:hypothetical protein